MKAPTTPPRRRSLFVRGYDRPPIEGRLAVKPRETSNRVQLLVMLILVISALLVTLFVTGYDSAKSGTPIIDSVGTPLRLPIIETLTVVKSDPSKLPPSKRMKIAVAVTVTRDGPYLDGAAVLQHSVRMTKSRHEIEMVAIVHAGVQTTRPALESLGFRIIEFPPPVESKDIVGKHLR